MAIVSKAPGNKDSEENVLFFLRIRGNLARSTWNVIAGAIFPEYALGSTVTHPIVYSNIQLGQPMSVDR